MVGSASEYRNSTILRATVATQHTFQIWNLDVSAASCKVTYKSISWLAASHLLHTEKGHNSSNNYSNDRLCCELHKMYTKTTIIAAVASLSAVAQAYTANAFVSHSDCGGNPET